MSQNCKKKFCMKDNWQMKMLYLLWSQTQFQKMS